MVIDKTQVKRILVITLSNVGDIILTTPVIGTLSKEFPSARIDVMVGPNGKEIFEKDPAVFKLIIYDKHLPISQKRRLHLKLKKLKYDMVVDLRNTIFPLLLGPRFRTGTIQRFPKDIIHSRQKHLYRLVSLGIENLIEPSYIYIPKEDEDYVSGLLAASGIAEPIVIINPGSKSHLKRWRPEGFAEVADLLIDECKASVVFVGMGEDAKIVSTIINKMKGRPYNLVDKTNIRQLASLMKRSKLIITNDSAPLHLGCAIGIKVLAIFGPTNPDRYGPTGEFDVVMSTKLSCSPCESATCERGHECMKLVSSADVFGAAKLMIEGYEEI
ncbi:MAG: glycosyltransferase family 9 protein [Candidatus Omnitrophota bacterium]|jgi:ADP-heptose:LPS heptosyltransferase